MQPFKNFLTEAKVANTILADINEIYVGYILAGNRWFDTDARKTFEQRVAQASPDQVEDAKGKAEAMAVAFNKWAKANGYSGRVSKVWWTARPGSMAAAVGKPVNQKKNPTDVLVKYTAGPADGFLGLSAKATKTKSDIGFKNPGIGTVDKYLDLQLGSMVKQEVDKAINKFGLPKSAKDRKAFIRANAEIKKQTEAMGVELMSNLRDQLFTRMSAMTKDELQKYIMAQWMDAEILYPPYIKVTGQGRRAPYQASVSDPIKNPKIEAITYNDITLSKVGNETIGVMAGKKKIMKIRFKFESQKLASSMKLTGDPW